MPFPFCNDRRSQKVLRLRFYRSSENGAFSIQGVLFCHPFHLTKPRIATKNFREASPKIVLPTMKIHRRGSSDIEKIEMDFYNPRKNARQQTAKICLPIPKSHLLCSEPGFRSTEKTMSSPVFERASTS